VPQWGRLFRQQTLLQTRRERAAYSAVAADAPHHEDGESVRRVRAKATARDNVDTSLVSLEPDAEVVEFIQRTIDRSVGVKNLKTFEQTSQIEENAR
jgi:hypothetical protein